MAHFPTPYKETLQKSKLTHDQISSLLKIQKRRWQSIFYGHSKCDSKEFRDIKSFVEKIQRSGKVDVI